MRQWSGIKVPWNNPDWYITGWIGIELNRQNECDGAEMDEFCTSRTEVQMKWSEVKWEKYSSECCAGNAFQSVLFFHRVIAERQVSIFTCLHSNSHLIARSYLILKLQICVRVYAQHLWIGFPSFHVLEFESNRPIPAVIQRKKSKDFLGNKVFYLFPFSTKRKINLLNT